ncbi:MAG: 30S ribosomal protein S2 [Candidatus Nealsonbacteria bacterium]
MAETKEKTKKLDLKLDPADMMQAGLHFGHKTSKIHPKIKPYLFGARNGVHIFDLEKTAEKLKEALEFIQKIISEEKVLLFVGTKVQIKELVKKAAIECGLPYISERWLGGTFTNFDIIKKRVDYLKELEEEKASGEQEKYTKKERIKINSEIEVLKLKFEGLKDLKSLPQAVFVADMKKDTLAIREAKVKGIKVIAIVDTNLDPTLADFPIPANDDAVNSVSYILEKIKETVLRSRTELPLAETKAKKKAEPSLTAKAKKDGKD